MFRTLKLDFGCDSQPSQTWECHFGSSWLDPGKLESSILGIWDLIWGDVGRSISRAWGLIWESPGVDFGNLGLDIGRGLGLAFRILGKLGVGIRKHNRE